MKKTIIHRVNVKTANQKISFQIRLPRNTNCIKEIAIHCMGSAGSITTQDVGSIWLTIPERRDTFYCDIVRRPFNEMNIQGFAPIHHIEQVTAFTHWTEGTKFKPFSVYVHGSVTLIEGFYTDLTASDFDESYTVNIYLTVEI